MADKIDNTVPYLLNSAKKEFREHFKKPDKDKVTGLYIIPSSSPVKDMHLFSSKF